MMKNKCGHFFIVGLFFFVTLAEGTTFDIWEEIGVQNEYSLNLDENLLFEAYNVEEACRIRIRNESWKWRADGSNFPNPMYEVCTPHCHRTHTGFFCNPEQILTSEQVRRHDVRLADIRRKAPCGCNRCAPDNRGHYAISVVIATELEPEPGERRSPRELIRSFAEALRLRWESTHGLCRDNSVVAVLTRYRLYSIAVGPHANTRITLRCLNWVERNVKHLFDSQKWDQGIASILNHLDEGVRAQKCYEFTNVGVEGGVIAGLVLSCMIILSFFSALGLGLVCMCRKGKDGSCAICRCEGGEEGEE